MQEFIYNSRDTSYTIEESGMAFLLDDQPLDLDEIRTRGKSAQWTTLRLEYLDQVFD